MIRDRTDQVWPLMTLWPSGWVWRPSIPTAAQPARHWPAQLKRRKGRDRLDQGQPSRRARRDPEFGGITGGSAGGHLTMLGALDDALACRRRCRSNGPPDWTNRHNYRHD